MHQEGRILSTDEELKWILEAYGDRYGEAAEEEVPINIPVSDTHVQICSQELDAQLQALHPRKAVPKGTAQPILLKACHECVADIVTHEVNEKWRQHPLQVDQAWSDASVALLPKPHGRSGSPLDWRPIGIQDALGKCVMSSIVRQARSEIIKLVQKFPQTAYIPGRHTGTALRRVFAHCHQIRLLSQSDRLTVHDRASGKHQQQCTGGLQISLDLSAAFDTVRWSHLKQALDLAGTPIHLQEVLLTWLVQVRYLFRHRDQAGHVTPKWGLRQGCVASPILWAAFTSLLCATLNDQLGETWTQEHATLYADDSHLQWRFQSYAQLERCLDEVQIAFKVFRLFHMKINIEKTKAILKVIGTLKSKVQKNFIRHHAQERRLLLSPKDPTRWLPLVSQTEYLGLIISYSSFELQSMRHRIAKANKRRWAMASILHTRKISVKYKLQLWRSCILSTLTYGLHTCGLTGDQLLEAQRHMMRHVRAVVSNQAHLTGDTHEYIMNTYNVATFADCLQQAQNREQVAAEKHQDWMWNQEWHTHLVQQLQIRTSSPQPDDTADCWMCHHCDASFVTSAALKTHARRMHGLQEENHNIFNKAKHSVDGLPKCSSCHKVFSKWQTLAEHINKNRCTKLLCVSEQPPENQIDKFEHMPAATTQNNVLCRRPEVVQAANQGINAFIKMQHVTSQLLQTCALCGQWCTSHRTVKRHYQYSHADVLQKFDKQITALVTRKASACPTCHFCTAKCKDWREHIRKCTVAWQCAVLVILQQDDGSGVGRVLRGSQDKPGEGTEKTPSGGRTDSIRSSEQGPGPQRAERRLLTSFFGPGWH